MRQVPQEVVLRDQQQPEGGGQVVVLVHADVIVRDGALVARADQEVVGDAWRGRGSVIQPASVG